MTEIAEADDIVLAVDTGPCESDRVFFRQHPRRNFRLRPAWSVEIEDFARHGLVPELSSGLCWWILVYQLAHGWRMRWPFPAPHYYPPDPPEQVARDVWRTSASRDMQKKFVLCGTSSPA